MKKLTETILFLARHGETDGNRQGLMLGHTDLPLNDVGIKHAQVLAKAFSGMNVDSIFSSDLSRARQTAEIIAIQLGKKLIVDKLLREMDYGDIDGIPISRIKEMEYGKRREHDKFGFMAPNGESYREVLGRVVEFIKKYEMDMEPTRTVIVSHLGTIRMFLYSTGQYDKEEAAALHFPHHAIAKLVLNLPDKLWAVNIEELHLPED
jgi:probable phosphoglycerate mutase